MSTILDALKRVEEQLRTGARRKAADGGTGGITLSGAREELALSRETVSGDNDEATRVYLSLVDMISRMQERAQTAIEEQRAQSGLALAELRVAIDGIRRDIAQQTDAFEGAVRDQSGQRETVDAAIDAMRSRIDALSQTKGGGDDAVLTLAETVAGLEADLARQREMFQDEVRRREAGHEAISAAHAQAESAHQILAESKDANVDLAKTVAALQADFARYREALETEVRARDAEGEADKAALAAAEARADSLKQALAENGKTVAELSQALASVQSDSARFREALENEVRARDVENEAGRLALASAQERTESLGQAVAELAQVFAALKDYSAYQQDSVQEGARRKGAKGESQRVAGAHYYELSKTLAEVQDTAAEMARSVSMLQADIARHETAIQHESAERDAAQGALASVQAQADSLNGRLAESAGTDAALAKRVAELRDEVAGLRESLQVESRQHAEDTASGKNALADAQSQIASVAIGLAESRDAESQFRNDLVSRMDLLEEDGRQRATERDAGLAALTTVQSEMESVRAALDAAGRSQTELSEGVSALRGQFAQQQDALRNEEVQRGAERETIEASLTELRSQGEALRSTLGETRDAQSQLGSRVSALQTDLFGRFDALEEEQLRYAVEFEAAEAKQADLRSHVDSLKRLLAESHEAHADSMRAITALQEEVSRRIEKLWDESRQHASALDATNVDVAGARRETGALLQRIAGIEASLADISDARLPGGGGNAVPEAKFDLDKYEAQKVHRAAVAAYTRGDYAESLRLLDLIDEAFPNNRSILYNRAECLIHLRRNDEAIRLCDYLVTVLDHAPAEELKKKIGL